MAPNDVAAPAANHDQTTTPAIGAPTRHAGRRASRRARQSRWIHLMLALLSIQFLAFGLWEAWRDAPTNDEPVIISAGVTALTRHDLRINNEHPPLPKVVAALPALAAHPIIPDDHSWRQGRTAFTAEFMQANRHAGKLRLLVFLARLIPLLEGLLVGLAAYALAATLFGRAAGMLAGAAWLTIAPAIGFSHIDGLDVPFALVTFALSLVLVRHLRSPTWANAIVVGITGGAALLTRWTALALVPVLVLVVGLSARRLPRRALLQAGTVLLVSWVTLWVGYRVIAPSSAPVVNGVLEDFHRAHSVPPANFAERVVELAPLPKEYQAGLRVQRVVRADSGHAFLLGQYWKGRRWWFWPATFLIKVPFTMLLLLVLAPLAWWKMDRRQLGPALAVVGLPGVVIACAIATQAPQEIGVRYLLPVIALAAVAAAPLTIVAARVLTLRAALVVAIATQLVLLYTAVPASLAWTQAPFRPGYRVAVDSNLDIGQDYYHLEDWARGRHPWIAWAGPLSSASIHGSKTLLGTDPRSIRGYVATNATALTYLYHRELSWLRAYCPIQAIEGTILVYRFKEPPDPRPGPDAPAPLCPGEASHRS